MTYASYIARMKTGRLAREAEEAEERAYAAERQVAALKKENERLAQILKEKK